MHVLVIKQMQTNKQTKRSKLSSFGYPLKIFIYGNLYSKSCLSVLSAELYTTLNIHEGRDGWPECEAVAVVLDVPDVFFDVWRLPDVHPVCFHPRTHQGSHFRSAAATVENVGIGLARRGTVRIHRKTPSCKHGTTRN